MAKLIYYVPFISFQLIYCISNMRCETQAILTSAMGITMTIDEWVYDFINDPAPA